MKKILIFISIFLFSLKVSAGEGDLRLNYNTGVLFNSLNTNSLIVNNILGIEYEIKNQACWEFYLTHAVPYHDSPKGLKPVYSNKSLGVGLAYKPVILRNMFLTTKNTLMRFRFAFDMGSEEKHSNSSFYCALGGAFEINRTFKNGMQISLMQKNEFVLWSDDFFRTGLLIGLKIPLN